MFSSFPAMRLLSEGNREKMRETLKTDEKGRLRMLKKIWFPFTVMILVLALAAFAAQATAYVLDYPAGQIGFLLEALLSLLLITGLTARVVRLRAPEAGEGSPVLRLRLPLLVGLAVLMLASQLMNSLLVRAGELGLADLFFSSFFSHILLVGGVWLLLALLGRFLWGLPFPAHSPRTVGRLCLTVLAGTALTFPLDALSLSLAYGWSGTVLGLYGTMTTAGVSLMALLHALSMAVSFAVISTAALIWADGV